MSLKWENASGGAIPNGAKAAGYESTGEKLYVARQAIGGSGLQLGKVRPGLGAALFPYGGAEISANNYEVLMDPNDYPNGYNPPGTGSATWDGAPATNFPTEAEKKGFVPPWFPNGAAYALSLNGLSTPANQLLEFHAIKCGQEQDGEPLFAALVSYKGGLQPGKVRLGLGGANISWDGAEIGGLNPYCVLCNGDYGFVDAVGGQIPDNSTEMGTDDDGTPLYLARSTGQLPGLQIGKARAGASNALISYGGNEVSVTSYQVLFDPASESLHSTTPVFGGGRWVTATDGSIPDGAVVLGCESDGTPMFGALSMSGSVGSGVQVGKIRYGFGGAYFPYNGKEVLQTNYQVLCTK